MNLLNITRLGVLFALLLICNTSILFAQVGCTVYMESPVNDAILNIYGVKDANDTGIEGVTVTITDAISTITTQMTTSDGTWRDPVANFPVRVVFKWPGKTWPSGSSFGLGNLSSIQFIRSPGNTIEYGLQDASHFVDSAPDLITTMVWNGSATADPMTIVNLMTQYNYPTSGLDTSTKNNSIETQRAAGGLYGVAYPKTEQRIFSLAFSKSHLGFGPKGIGGKYEFEDEGLGLGLDASFDLQGVTPSNVNTALDFSTITRVESLGVNANYLGSGGTSRYDVAYGKVGGMSIGDFDFGYDGKLYFVNLFQQWLVRIDLSASTASLDNASVGMLGSLFEAYDLVGSNGMPFCSKGKIRPFGLAIHEEKGDWGIVCDGSGLNITCFYSTFNWDGDSKISKYVAPDDEALDGNGCDVYLSKNLILLS